MRCFARVCEPRALFGLARSHGSERRSRCSQLTAEWVRAHSRRTRRSSKEKNTDMAHHGDIPRETYPAETLDGRGYALARLLSQAFHPILLNILAFLIVGYGSMSTHTAGLKWAG